MNIEHKVIEIIAEQAVLEVSDVSESSTLVDLGIDSLGLVESIFAIEEEFDISNVKSIITGIKILIAEQQN